jgi:hypothetical protein
MLKPTLDAETLSLCPFFPESANLEHSGILKVRVLN